MFIGAENLFKSAINITPGAGQDHPLKWTRLNAIRVPSFALKQSFHSPAMEPSALIDKIADRPIYKSDVDKPTPYNTYIINGLPPTPIANPGREAMEAVANPSTTDELFFVADGTGGHVFARTLDEHNENVRRWREVERQREAEANKAASEAAGGEETAQ